MKAIRRVWTISGIVSRPQADYMDVDRAGPGNDALHERISLLGTKALLSAGAHNELRGPNRLSKLNERRGRFIGHDLLILSSEFFKQSPARLEGFRCAAGGEPIRSTDMHT